MTKQKLLAQFVARRGALSNTLAALEDTVSCG
jgi:hypothetical protein